MNAGIGQFGEDSTSNSKNSQRRLLKHCADDDDAEDAENVSDQIQDDEVQTDNAELAEYGAELMSDDDNNGRDSA
ncbi:hypothetical protein JTB14_035055 [Gonioctena quinquepunctata]|nr:hypothetical protein JTB14_035055 [Gonioctena quinquepunctata]